MKTIREATDEERQAATEWYEKIDKTNEKLLRAVKLAVKLGVGGVWRGRHLAVKTLYDAL